MTKNELLQALFPDGHDIREENALLTGHGRLPNAGPVAVIGVTDKAALGVDEALKLSAFVLSVAQAAADRDDAPMPILVLIDSDSQRMSKRDELMGLSQYLSHLAVCLRMADTRGHHTLGLLYGSTAAGAFIATALATRTLLALPGAHPAVMDLPSMAKVTKLPLALLQEKAQGTPVFAPGLDNLNQMGAVTETLNPEGDLVAQIERHLNQDASGDVRDGRDQRGQALGGRPKAATIAQRVYDAAIAAD